MAYTGKQILCSKIESEGMFSRKWSCNPGYSLWTKTQIAHYLWSFIIFFLILFGVTHHWCHWASVPSLTQIHRPQCRTPSVHSQGKINDNSFSNYAHLLYHLIQFLPWECESMGKKSTSLPVSIYQLATHPFIFFILVHVLNGVLEVFNCKLHENMGENSTN